MDRTLRACLTEFAGTFVLVFVCTATVIAAQLALRDAPLGLGLAGLAVAQGCVLAVLLWTTSALAGGCLNPAMTLALWVTRRFDAGRALALIVVQLAAAVAAGGLAVALFNQDVLFRAQGGTPHLQPALRETGGGLSVGGLLLGAAVEAAASFLLTLVLFATVYDTRRTKQGPLYAGLAQATGVLLAQNLTGAGINPARWLGPAVWQATVPLLQGLPHFDDHAVYWLGPIVGALLASVVYTALIEPPRQEA
jgi:aquaporin TIP